MSAIYIPRGDDATPSELVELIGQPPLSTLVRALPSLEPVAIAQLLSTQHPLLLKPYTKEQVSRAIKVVLNPETFVDTGPETQATEELEFRLEEYRVIREPQRQAELLVRSADLTQSPFLQKFFARITLLHKLRETRVLTGFSRLSPEDPPGDYGEQMRRRQELMWRVLPPPHKRWLPAVKVYGEGIFLEFNEARLKAWECKDHVEERFKPVDQRNRDVSGGYGREGAITPRLMLIHTFAHLLMNQLVFASGYSAASLKERLFVSTDPTSEMAGVLIYTAAGDSEGTLGGLVRLGKPEFLEMVIRQALDAAQWCSADPVCMESGERGGQGPGSLNLAACHSCALVPETACEEFNRFLDRGSVIGNANAADLGYFQDWQI